MRHLAVDNFHRSAPYKSPKGFGKAPVPVRSNPAAHGRALMGWALSLRATSRKRRMGWPPQGCRGGLTRREPEGL